MGSTWVKSQGPPLADHNQNVQTESQMGKHIISLAEVTNKRFLPPALLLKSVLASQDKTDGQAVVLKLIQSCCTPLRSLLSGSMRFQKHLICCHTRDERPLVCVVRQGCSARSNGQSLSPGGPDVIFECLFCFLCAWERTFIEFSRLSLRTISTLIFVSGPGHSTLCSDWVGPPVYLFRHLVFQFSHFISSAHSWSSVPGKYDL